MTEISISAAEFGSKECSGIITAISQTFTFAHRAMIKAFRNPESLADVAVMPIMFTLLFAYLFGGAISGSTDAYLPVVIPGILIMTLVTSCGTSGIQIREDMDKSITSRFKSMPVARFAPVAGILIADLVRFAIAGAVVFVAGYAIGYRPEWSMILACILFMMFFAWCLSWLFAFVSISVKSSAMATSAAMMILFPLTFLSNAFVPAETMPSVLQFFVNSINPLTKAVSSVREMLTYGTIDTDFWLSLLGAAAILAVFIPLTLRRYMRKT
ncbi:MAG: ABC transporter permease [Candidatus Methanoplasma sp.]|jgi:ABC-2 type transport system permease protein|nr:ABC transporter permease [Candidatus Methanoplasma sp.]